MRPGPAIWPEGGVARRRAVRVGADADVDARAVFDHPASGLRRGAGVIGQYTRDRALRVHAPPPCTDAATTEADPPAGASPGLRAAGVAR